MIDTTACRLWELFAAQKVSRRLARGLRRDLRPPLERPPAATAGRRPMRPACRSTRVSPATTRSPPGVIAHALRFTVPETRNTHIYPARHDASSLTGASYPPMGLRLRLKASVNISGYGPQSRVSSAP